MSYIKITNFVVIRYLEKDHSMTKTSRLKKNFFSCKQFQVLSFQEKLFNIIFNENWCEWKWWEWWEWWKCIFNKTGFKVFYVIMKRNPIITNFKRTIYQTFKSANLIWKRCKTLKISEKSCTGRFVICFMCEILIIDIWNEYITKRDGMVNLFSMANLMLRWISFKKFKKSNESCSL